MDTNPDHDDIISELSTFYENRRNTKNRSPALIHNMKANGHRPWHTKIHMFITARNLTNLILTDIIYGDDTFYTSPTQVTQIYTLHAMVDDVMYPLVFGLLPDKSEEI